MVHSNILRQYILSCLVALLLYVKVINIIINDNNLEVIKNNKDVPAYKKFLAANFKDFFK